MTVDTHTGEIVEFDQAAAERRAERINLRLDAIADNYRAVLPMIRDAIEKRDDQALGYRSVGEYVQDRFGGALTNLGVDVRRAVVGELTDAGMSTRAIAPVVGVHHDTVARDARRVVDTTPESQAPEPVAAGKTSGSELRAHRSTAYAGSGPTPQGEARDGRPDEAASPRPAVTGIDGKTYARPTPTPGVERVREERRQAEEIERGQRDTCTRIAECVRFLDGGAEYAQIFLRDFYPHEERHLADGMRLTRERVQSAIEFLTTVE